MSDLDEAQLLKIRHEVRFSQITLENTVLRASTEEETQRTIKSFCDLRPDGHGLNSKEKVVVLLEFTRAMDRQDDWEAVKHQEKLDRYAPVLSFFNSLPGQEGWSMKQLNFTVGVRGSISTKHFKIPPFTAALEELGLTHSEINKTRKATAKRIFEAHDLMLRSYYAARHGKTVNLPHLLQSASALQHCLRVPAGRR